MSTFAKLNYRSDLYSKFRPVYSKSLFNAIYEFHQSNCDNQQDLFDTAVDVGTGTGQIAKDLALKFKEVYGTDTSKTMISSAVERDNISYSVLGAEEISSAFEESSVDVITVGQAFHWIKHSQFFDAAKHVLKPGGTLAIIGYGFVAVKGSPAATKLIKDLGEVKFKDYWEPGRELVNNLYRDIEYPFKTVEWHITPEEADITHLNQGDTNESFMSTDISVEALGNYLKTWSSYFTYMKKTGDTEDPVDNVIKKIMSVMNLKDSNEIIRIEFPTALILCRNR